LSSAAALPERPPAPPVNIPIMAITIIIGYIKNIGLRVMSRPPTVTISAIIPITATIMTNGINFRYSLAGITRGTSGGGCRLTSPPGMRGGLTRGRRTNPWVTTVPPNIDTRCIILLRRAVVSQHHLKRKGKGPSR
jgi:hypothetical protein